MENYKYDLDMINVELRTAANLLSCFTEFCNDECNFLQKDEASKAICIALRLSTFRSLIDASLSILHEEIEIINTRVERGDT